MYVITEYTKAMAEELGVQVELSSRHGKKIKVTIHTKVYHLGDIELSDYATMLVQCEAGEMNIKHADKRRDAFRKRWASRMQPPGGAYWVGKLLWLL